MIMVGFHATSALFLPLTFKNIVLTSEYASLVAMEFNMNPVVNDEAAFDIYPP
jgi:hypothetical protein